MDVRGWGWRHASRRAWAVERVDLAIEPGERVLLLGASGAGKSTLLHGIAGLLGGGDEGESRGEILVDGRPSDTMRARIGLVLQDPENQAVLARVGDDVAFGLENLAVDPNVIRTAVPAALERVGLGGIPLDHSTSSLSGGQKQRLALAGVLAMQPGLLLLDEPTANLDPDGVVQLRDAVLASLDGRTLVVIEHRVSTWWHAVDRIVVLGTDGVLADGRPDTVLGAERERLAAAGVWLPPLDPTASPPSIALPAPPRDEADPLMTARALSVGRRRKAVAASQLGFALSAGSAMAITGPNGAGKSTTALTIAGLLPPAAGELVAGDSLRRGAGPSPHAWRSRQLLDRIGTVFQSPEHQFLAQSVRQELELGPRALGADAPGAARIAEEFAERLGLAHLLRAHPFSLSGGEKRRLSVATVLTASPSLIVLDEPTFGQDARTWGELVRLLREQLAGGRSIVAVTHDREVVDALCDVELRLTAPSSRAGGDR